MTMTPIMDGACCDGNGNGWDSNDDGDDYGVNEDLEVLANVFIKFSYYFFF